MSNTRTSPPIHLLRELLDAQRLIALVVSSLATERGTARVVREIQRESLLGFAMVNDRLGRALTECDVVSFSPSLGMPVDIGMHEVLACVESEEHPPGTIAEVLRTGHAFGDGVPVEKALVKVFQRPLQRNGGQACGIKGDVK